jgi:hypothetical protein
MTDGESTGCLLALYSLMARFVFVQIGVQIQEIVYLVR